MNRVRLLSLVPFALCSLSLSSCGTGPLVQGPLVPHRVPFDETGLAYARRSGTASVSGQLGVKFIDGHMIHGRNSKVELMPKTPYTTEIVNRQFIHKENLAPADPRLAGYVRTTTADWSGNFVFNNVPAGDYIVCGVVNWKDAEEISDQDDAGSTTAIGWWTNHQWSWEHIKVAGGQSVHVIVTP